MKYVLQVTLSFFAPFLSLLAKHVTILRAFALTAPLLVTTMGFGAATSVFSAAVLQETKAQIQLYLEPGTASTGQSHLLRNLEIKSLTAVDLILEAVLHRWHRGSLTSGDRRRIDVALRQAGDFVLIYHNSETTLLADIKTKADALLSYYVIRSEGQDALISLFNILDLWTETNYSFYLNYLKSLRDMMETAPRLRQALPFLKSDQRQTLAESIRKVRPYTLIQLSIIYDLGLATEADLLKLFTLAADRFAQRQAPIIAYEYGEWRQHVRLDRLFDPTFTQLLRVLHSGDPVVVNAFNKSRLQAQRLKNRATGRAREQFFYLMGNKGMNWLQRLTWVDPALSGEGPAVQPAYNVEGNLITVRFTRPTCETKLK